MNELRVNTYVACLLITIVGSLAAVAIIKVSYLTYAPPYLVGATVAP